MEEGKELYSKISRFASPVWRRRTGAEAPNRGDADAGLEGRLFHGCWGNPKGFAQSHERDARAYIGARGRRLLRLRSGQVRATLGEHPTTG